jgi:hypothetical protein
MIEYYLLSKIKILNLKYDMEIIISVLVSALFTITVYFYNKRDKE